MSQNPKRNRFFDSFTENVGVPTNYVSLAIEPSFSHILFC
ncbi:hypothetical protein LEP1GSC171_3943 [Leptospira santarosai str. HAI1380]|nr:hypothetical protein LEP1GSC071_0664 [Leptospira santarosai str. JET]EMP00866.1 hypothetical protein LEP1GSC171_3943 [Leptospira santarosai str. HAI1380]